MSVPLVSGALTLASTVSIGMSNFFGGLASRSTSAMSAVIWMELVSVLPALAVAGVTTGTLSLAMVADGVVIGVIAGGGLVCYYRALSVGAMAIAAPLVGSISAALPVVVGLTTGDRLHLLQLVGLVAAVIAIVIVALPGGWLGIDAGHRAGGHRRVVVGRELLLRQGWFPGGVRGRRCRRGARWAQS